MSTETTVKAGSIVTGHVANLLPVGSQIRYADGDAQDAWVLTKTEDVSKDAEWGLPGEPGWGIDLAARWVIVSIADGEPR